LVLLPLAAVFTVTTASQGLWILAVPGFVFFALQLIVFIRASRRRPVRRAPEPPPQAAPAPSSTRPGRRTTPRERALARQRRRGR
jgi:hypothetical protein